MTTRKVPDEFIDKMFAVMALTPWHTYQVLTKRIERAQQYLVQGDRQLAVTASAFDMCIESLRVNPRSELGRGLLLGDEGLIGWPLPNVWLGVTALNHSQESTMKLQIRFAGPPGPVAGRFVEVEDENGSSITAGQWVQDGDYWLLVINTDDEMSQREIDRLVGRY